MGFRKPSFGAHKHAKAADLKSHDREDREAIVVHSSIGSQSSLDKNEVFGDGDVNYRSVGWASTAVLLVKSQIGVGVLGIPATFHSLGLIPGILIFLFFAVLTTWSDYYLGVFKIKHPSVYSLQDCMTLVFGRWGGEFFGWSYWFFTAMVGASALLTIFVAVAAIATYPVASLRTLDKIKWLGWPALITIVIAIMIVVIGVAVGGRPSLAPQEGPIDLQMRLFNSPSFSEAMTAVSSLLFAFSGTPAFLPIASEMRDSRDFKKAVLLCQTFVTSFYLTVGVVVYYYAGQYVASPALGTAGPLLKRISYGFSLPGLLFTSVFYTHMPAKFLFMRLLRGTRHLTNSTKTHWVVWLSCVLVTLLFSYIVSSAIPVFSSLIGLVGAIFASLLCLHAEAFMYLFDVRARVRQGERTSFSTKFAIVYNVVVILVASFVLVAGAYGSVISIRDDYRANGGRPWSCADNSGSV
ncbi:hypothetical protein Rhopal_000046-T1 [Rhodotorula paludigena]|uniref:Amino acid transporter transmembrane domain-containing protein n=1 Tax=Rhodotorula paludigena TaxID=86838 RepID=A0AAV5GBS3_9BASI|nr:hypothetical protein Rhopal_000046-T1 [Rhodotorula paludigena]